MAQDVRFHTDLADVCGITDITSVDVAFNWVGIGHTELVVIGWNKSVVAFLAEVISSAGITVGDITDECSDTGISDKFEIIGTLGTDVDFIGT